MFTQEHMMDGTTPDIIKEFSPTLQIRQEFFILPQTLLPVVNTMISKLRMPNIPLRWINLTEEQ